MEPQNPAYKIGRAQALRQLPGPSGERFAELFHHGSLTVEIYAPVGEDNQRPHTRDELYVVIEGEGTFAIDGRRESFVAGDALFAPAGFPHRFEDFGAKLQVWVMFYGPEGGEAGDD